MFMFIPAAVLTGGDWRRLPSLLEASAAAGMSEEGSLCNAKLNAETSSIVPAALFTNNGARLELLMFIIHTRFGQIP
jgi:hypothetical protein